MKHYIDAPAGSESFKQQFAAIRDAFIGKLKLHVAGRTIRTFKIVGLEMGPVDGIRSVDDAERVIASMIDEGFSVAFRGIKGFLGLKIHICYWEDPVKGPEWPWGVALFEEVHDGVVRGKPDQHGA